MYQITKQGIIKRLETWNLIIPLYDNDGNKFSDITLERILENISVNYPGFTIINCIGYWKDKNKLYRDENYQIIIDTVSSNKLDSLHFFSNLKNELTIKLNQEKIYITKTNDKEELLSFLEFFKEIGLDIDFERTSKDETINLVQQIVNSQDYIFKRLGYETVVLQRDIKNKTIIWERNVCGIRLKSTIEDVYPEESIIIGADQIEKLGSAFFETKNIILVGKYEFQGFILEKFNYRPLVESNYSSLQNEEVFLDNHGKPITIKRFIELFSMSIFCNYLALREENYLENEIKINVGNDGSMQIGENLINGNCLLHIPATINEHSIQLEILECLKKIIDLFEKNNLDHIALLQAKARNNYINNRALIRKFINQKNN